MQCSLYFLFSSLFVSFPNLHFQLRALTSALQPPVTVLGLPLPFEIIYWSGAVDYLFFFSRLISFLRLFAFVFFSFFFIHDVDSNHLTALYTRTIASNLSSPEYEVLSSATYIRDPGIDKVPSKTVETTRGEWGDNKVVTLTIGTLSHYSGTCAGRSRARNIRRTKQSQLVGM